jgi:hypothetical protein
MKIKVELNPLQTIFVSLGIQERGRAQLYLANEATRRMSKYVPFRTGKLRDTVDIQPNFVTYLMPYARRQYYTNKGRGITGRWWRQKMMTAEGSQLIADVQNYVSRGAK